MPAVSLEPRSTVDTVGWVSSPGTRGTFDILWTCAQTVALCAWTSVCTNIPAPNRDEDCRKCLLPIRTYEMLRDKFNFLLLTLLGPELVFLLAYNQYRSAKASVSLFKDKYPGWTIQHAFYADMGGIHVRPPGWTTFPVNAKQLYYLVDRGYVQYPDIPVEVIKGSSKKDRLVRLIAIAQALYFLVNTIARFLQHLAVTTLELTVFGFVLCMLATSICWWHKPSDVELIHEYELQVDIDTVFRNANGKAKELYRNTPLDFVAPAEWIGYNLWTYYVNILRKLRLTSPLSPGRPDRRISSFNWPRPQSKRSELVVLGVGCMYASTFFGAWDFYFPTSVEHDFWRDVCALQLAIVVLVGSFELYNMPEPNEHGNGSTTGQSDSECPVEKRTKAGKRQSFVSRFWSRPCNNSDGQPQALQVPLRSLIVTTPLCAAYCVCRWFLLLEDIISLRSQPASTYQQVKWTTYWPKF